MPILKFLIPVLFILLAVYQFYKNWLFETTAPQTVGKIVAIDYKVVATTENNADVWGYEFSVAFKPENGADTVVTYTNLETDFYYVGMEVNVLYDRQDPAHFVINGEHRSSWHTAMCGCALLFLGVLSLLIALTI